MEPRDPEDDPKISFADIRPSLGHVTYMSGGNATWAGVAVPVVVRGQPR